VQAEMAAEVCRSLLVEVLTLPSFWIRNGDDLDVGSGVIIVIQDDTLNSCTVGADDYIQYLARARASEP